MRKCLLVLTFLTVAAFAVFASSLHNEAGLAQQGAGVGQEVIDALQSQDEVTVDIALVSPPSLEARPLRVSAVTKDVAIVQNAVLAELSGADFQLSRRFEAVPVLIGTVTQSGLKKLLANPNVLRVDLPAAGTGHLAQSVPLIEADRMHTVGFTGKGVVVAVLDSGLDTDHPQLANDLRAPQECFNIGADLTVNGVGGCPGGGETQSGAGAAEDGHGHGTNVTGIITATGGGIFSIGVAPDADIAAYRVLDDGNFFYSFTFDIVGALNDIILNRPEIDIINMSVGTNALFAGNCDATTAWNIAGATAIDTLRANGVIAFASSGNEGSGIQMTSPACLSNVVSVGAVYDANVGPVTIFGCTDAATAADQVTCFTNSNATTDIMAPGAPTTSTGLAAGTSTYFGTSQASPHGAGCAALLLQQNPALTPAQIEARLETSAVSVTDATNGLSFPRIDCFAPAVGGIAELPEVAGAPLETSGSSDDRTGVLAGIVSAAAAGAIALGSAAWYARRRNDTEG